MGPANQKHPLSIKDTHEETNLEDYIVTRSQVFRVTANHCVVGRDNERRKIRATGHLREGIEGNPAGPEHSVLPDDGVEVVLLEPACSSFAIERASVELPMKSIGCGFGG